MPITCPACSKSNDAGETCVRCGCDLSLLREILGASMSHLSLAKQELQAGDWAAALAHAERSWELAHNSPTARLGCFAAAALGDTEGFARWRRRAEGD